MSATPSKDGRHQGKLGPAEMACFHCPHPECIWHYGKHRNYCPIQRERMAKEKRT